ncbi:MAG: hypothetical protein GX226_01685 [Dehalococcoidales bacterium]|jgi:hypothetical protein|nr:hypothetical protein [Dehalococcoidales bacterium]
MAMIVGFTLGGLLILTGGVSVFFCITEFFVFASHNLQWLAIVFLIMGVFAVLGGAYLIYNLLKRS